MGRYAGIELVGVHRPGSGCRHDQWPRHQYRARTGTQKVTVRTQPGQDRAGGSGLRSFLDRTQSRAPPRRINAGRSSEFPHGGEHLQVRSARGSRRIQQGMGDRKGSSGAPRPFGLEQQQSDTAVHGVVGRCAVRSAAGIRLVDDSLFDHSQYPGLVAVNQRELCGALWSVTSQGAERKIRTVSAVAFLEQQPHLQQPGSVSSRAALGSSRASAAAIPVVAALR